MNKHPYELRLWLRERLPWFIINLGIAEKGKDCESVNAEHVWYNKGDNLSGCYYCKITKQGQLWENENNENN